VRSGAAVRGRGGGGRARNSSFHGVLYPCPCGFTGDPSRPCSCAPSAITRDQKRISGLLLDRIGISIPIHREVPRIEFNQLTKRFGKYAAFDDTTFAVPRGSRACGTSYAEYIAGGRDHGAGVGRRGETAKLMSSEPSLSP
jgi:hypothetical protein